jgi:hypothetical protein
MAGLFVVVVVVVVHLLFVVYLCRKGRTAYHSGINIDGRRAPDTM